MHLFQAAFYLQVGVRSGGISMQWTWLRGFDFVCKVSRCCLCLIGADYIWGLAYCLCVSLTLHCSHDRFRLLATMPTPRIFLYSDTGPRKEILHDLKTRQLIPLFYGFGRSHISCRDCVQQAQNSTRSLLFPACHRKDLALPALSQ
jgi:hypothetical protein